MGRFELLSVSTRRPLPVIILADVSGSMGQEGKIQALNRAVAEMLASFTEEDDLRAEIQVAIITFGEQGARLHLPLTQAARAAWQEMPASGKTPMGAAFSLAAQLVADRAQIPSQAYTPTLVLASDGVPTDEWRDPLQGLLGDERARKAQRLALAIGADAEEAMLRAFVGDPAGRVFHAGDAREIRRFFRFATMTVLSRSRSVNPDQPVLPEPADIDHLDY